MSVNIENKCENCFHKGVCNHQKTYTNYITQAADIAPYELVFKTLKDTTVDLNPIKTPMELRPFFSKPKTKTRTLEDVVDEVLYCKNCGSYICYPTEHNTKDEYKYCPRCGKLLY